MYIPYPRVNCLKTIHHTLHSGTYLYSPYMAVPLPPPRPPGHHTEPLPVCFRIPDRQAKRNPASRAQILMNLASRVAVRSCCLSRHSAFSRIPHRISVKSRILKIPSRPCIKRLLSPRLQGPVVRTPVSANPGLNFNPGFFIFLSKVLSRIIFSFLFRVSNYQIVGKEN